MVLILYYSIERTRSVRSDVRIRMSAARQNVSDSMPDFLMSSIIAENAQRSFPKEIETTLVTIVTKGKNLINRGIFRLRKSKFQRGCLLLL